MENPYVFPEIYEAPIIESSGQEDSSQNPTVNSSVDKNSLIIFVLFAMLISVPLKNKQVPTAHGSSNRPLTISKEVVGKEFVFESTRGEEASSNL
ncbi:unnamed protein product [marine sediment metagenome]|uniref:Uncharacterized protein n=1 Tax=marine sediment metagenome TaxID=412755 RepID=X1FGP8_9ZZZZ